MRLEAQCSYTLAVNSSIAQISCCAHPHTHTPTHTGVLVHHPHTLHHCTRVTHCSSCTGVQKVRIQVRTAREQWVPAKCPHVSSIVAYAQV